MSQCKKSVNGSKVDKILFVGYCFYFCILYDLDLFLTGSVGLRSPFCLDAVLETQLLI